MRDLALWLMEWIRVLLVQGRLSYRYASLLPPIVRVLAARDEAARRLAWKKPVSAVRFLTVGQLRFGDTGWSRWQAARKVFGAAEGMDISPWIVGLPVWGRVWTNHLYHSAAIRDLNRQLLRKVSDFQPDLLWVEKGLHLFPETLRQIQSGGAMQIHFSPDNQMVFANQSRHYLASVPLYDLHVTTKRHNVDWLMRCGARRVECMGKGFDPELHRPMELTDPEREKYGCDIGFVGHQEPGREALLLKLWKLGFRMKVWGGGWRRASLRKHPLFQNASHLVGEEYVKAICGAKINLCLLSAWFGDRSTARSVEIPACGQFMLGERTEEHQALFKEGEEAEFYATQQEMLEKIGHYLRREEERRKIAQAGRARSLQGYTHEARWRELSAQVMGTEPCAG